MSLKSFHIVFILLSIALSFGFGLWAVREYSSTGLILNLVMGYAALTAGVVLVAYLPWFLFKMRKISLP